MRNKDVEENEAAIVEALRQRLSSAVQELQRHGYWGEVKIYATRDVEDPADRWYGTVTLDLKDMEAILKRLPKPQYVQGTLF